MRKSTPPHEFSFEQETQVETKNSLMSLVHSKQEQRIEHPKDHYKRRRYLGLIRNAYVITTAVIISTSASSSTSVSAFSSRGLALWKARPMTSIHPSQHEGEMCPSFLAFETNHYALLNDSKRPSIRMSSGPLMASHATNSNKNSSEGNQGQNKKRNKRQRKASSGNKRKTLIVATAATPLSPRKPRSSKHNNTTTRKHSIVNKNNDITISTSTNSNSNSNDSKYSKKFIRQEAIDYLLSDDADDDDDDDYNMKSQNEDQGNELADKINFQKLSDEAKFTTTLALRSTKKNKVTASVKETGNDTMSHYLKSMGSHELLRKEDEVILGRQVQIFVKWEALRLELEEEFLRTPTYAEWANKIGTTVPELKKQIRRSQRAKAALIEANLRLVVMLARQSMKSNRNKSEISFQDACQEGIIGLAKACEKFDPEKGFRFSTYANWYIKRFVNENVLDQSRSMKIPYHVAMKINQIQITEVTLKKDLGRRPTDEEIAKKLDISLEHLEFYREKSLKAFSLDKSITPKSGKGSSASYGGAGNNEGGGAFTINDTIGDPSSNPTETVNKQMLRDDVKRLITTLSPREQAVIRLRFGVDDGRPRTLDHIAQKFGVTVEKIRKVESRALLKLKQPYRSNTVKCYISDL